MNKESIDEQDLKQLREAFDRLSEMPNIPMTIQPIAAVMLLGQLQLALRHPTNKGQGADFTRKIAKDLQSAIVKLYPLIADYLEKGWYQIFDRTPDGGEAKKAKFADLDRDRQEHILVNSHALLIATMTISQMTGTDFKVVANDLARRSNEHIDKCNDLQLAQAIKEMDEDYEIDKR